MRKFFKKVFYTQNKEAREFNELLHILEHFLDIKDSKTILTSLKYNYKKIFSLHYLEKYPQIGNVVKNIYSKYSQVPENKFNNTEIIYFRDEVKKALVELKQIYQTEQTFSKEEISNDDENLSQAFRILEGFLHVKNGNDLVSNLKNNKLKLLSENFLTKHEKTKEKIKKIYY
ncbi:MAG: hypothetical protein KC589_09000, partial [Nanoarchaeota archaeon]|nr:hypothetical protein [Nanoarchaeota archaeon]